MTLKRKFWLKIVGLVLFGIALIAAAPFVFLWDNCGVKDYVYETDFDQARWANERAVSEDWNLRINMVEDLLSEYDLGTMAKGDVLELLGPPTETDYFPDWDMVYWLGPERGCFGWDSEWLVLMIDNDKRVSDFRIVRD